MCTIFFSPNGVTVGTNECKSAGIVLLHEQQYLEYFARTITELELNNIFA